MADINAIRNNSSTGGFNNASNPILTYQPGALPTSAQKMSEETVGGSSLQFLQDQGKYYFQIELADYNRTSLYAAQQVSFSSGTSIILPLPEKLMNHLVAGWNDKPLELMGTLAVEAALAASQGDAKKAAANVGAAVGTAAAAAFASEAGGMANKIAGSVVEAAQPALGYSISKFVVVTYSGPKYKRHNFTWKLVPRNAGESESLRKIVKELHNAASPGIGLGGAVFQFPKIARFSYLPNPKYIYKFKPAVIVSIAADYAGAGQPAFFRQDPATDNLNAPEHVVLSLQALELEYWLKADFTDSNDATDVYGGDANQGTVPQVLTNLYNDAQTLSRNTYSAQGGMLQGPGGG